MDRIDILIFDGFDELDALGPYEVLRNAGLDARLVSVDGSAPVTASHGAVLQPAGPLREDAELILVPGGGWNDRSDAGAWQLAREGTVPRLLADRHAAGTAVGSVCTGAMLLAAAGITDGRPATTHHSAHEALRESGAQLVVERVVDDGDLITAGGVTSGIDLALWIVERERGRAAADAVAEEMEHERRGRVLQPHG